ncbi:phosphoenolpyruvate carboxykinase (ATP) [Alkalicoccobacillus murimartini]|uniref:Phosphoenolpyruvate carboxykinase (ATP) n=1 Tax=Alkalicoccobacillus murimartini TaxID=171685 RepID=A0ABT9YK30_9BACI|nr:phosphoenolpyruvate carboxykinase (ATP) [Alkalicoccobacillus murimartini]MDQ0208208.1 phosphoenolpyruvate carboxykinase (ATP) [Alkalicoccobacillus murimartini]
MKTMNMPIKLEQLLSSPQMKHDLSVSRLVEQSIERGEGTLTSTGALSVETGAYTGRSPKDKFVVRESLVEHTIDWGPVNQPLSKDIFTALYHKVLTHLGEKEELFASQGFAGADTNYRLPIQVINEFAWHQIFARQLFIRPSSTDEKLEREPFTIVSAPTFKAVPEIDGTHSEAFVMISFEERVILIGGTEYAGEMKKSIFSIMNYLLPEEGVLSMHCSANTGAEGDVALFFGLSGTGKTTLSASPDRLLIGDDEHAWSENGVFNIEGGCYAKCVNLSQEKEPQIWNAIKFGTVLENVVVSDVTGEPNYDDISLTENTRAAYPIDYIPNALEPSVAGHPSTIIFLTADAFGVLPPISKLTPEQAMYHFLSGYTSKLAGTERGITEPEVTFSTCFGAPFLPLPAHRYASMLGDLISKHNVDVFLVNTGWSGGPYGVGERMKLAHTRSMVQAALQGELSNVATTEDPVFGLHIPEHCPGVPDIVLQPKSTWPNPEAYELKAKELADNFKQNFTKFTGLSKDIVEAGPK